MPFLPKLSIPLPETQPSDWDEFTIQDFSGGLCTNLPESNIRDNQFVALTNWYIEDDNSIKVRGPYRPYLVTVYDTVLATAPLSFKFIELGTTDYLLTARDAGSNYQVDYWDTNAFTKIDGSLTDGNKVEFFKFSINDQEDILFCNGKDLPRRWTGSGSSTNLGLSAPVLGNPTSTESIVESQRGLTHTGNYYYKFTSFYDNSSTKYGESGPTASTSAVAVTGSTSDPSVVTFSSCPAIPTDATKNFVYRSPQGEDNGPYREVGFYDTGTSFVDTMPDGEEGVEVPADAGTPPRLKHPLSHKNRVWGIGLTSAGALKNKGVWSNSKQPDMFPALNYAYFPDELAGPVAFRENIYWFTRKKIYVTPNGDVDTYPEPLKICNKGCTSFKSIVDVGNGLVFQGEDNIYWVDFNTQAEDGDFPIPIGEPIRDKIENIPTTYVTNSVGHLKKGNYILSYTGPNQTVNTATLVWNVEKGIRLLVQGLFGAWTSLDWSANDMQEFKGTFYTADNTNKYIMEHDFAGAVDFTSETNYDASSSNTIATEFKSKNFHFGHEWAKKIVNSLSISVETSGATYNATVSLDSGDYKRTKSFVLGSGTLAVDSNWLIWGQGTWDNFNWGSTSYGFESGHKKIGAGAKGRNVQLTLISTDSKDTNLIFLKLYYKTLPKPS